MKRKAIFFDRDGIVNVRLQNDYVKTIEEFDLIPEFLNLFSAIDDSFLKILITNQQGIGKGLMSESDLTVIHEFMQTGLIASTGKRFDDIYSCPDLATKENNCRKPKPTMLIDAINKWNIDPLMSFMIGDSLSDYQAGKAAGVNTILVGDHTTEEAPDCDYIITSLNDAIRIIQG